MMAIRLSQSAVIGLLAIAFLVTSSESRTGKAQPIVRDLEMEALQEAVSWPNAKTQTVMTLVGQFVAGHRDQEAYAYFQERARSRHGSRPTSLLQRTGPGRAPEILREIRNGSGGPGLGPSEQGALPTRTSPQCLPWVGASLHDPRTR